MEIRGGQGFDQEVAKIVHSDTGVQFPSPPPPGTVLTTACCGKKVKATGNSTVGKRSGTIFISVLTDPLGDGTFHQPVKWIPLSSIKKLALKK